MIEGAVLFKQSLQFVKVSRLVCCLAPHVFLEVKIGYLRVKMIWIYVVCGRSCAFMSPENAFVEVWVRLRLKRLN